MISAITARKFDHIANAKGHSGYFGWCFFLGVIGWAMVIALPDRKIAFPDFSVLLDLKSKGAYKNAISEENDRLPEL